MYCPNAQPNTCLPTRATMYYALHTLHHVLSKSKHWGNLRQWVLWKNLEMQKAVIAVILFVLFSPHTVLILGKKRALQSQAETQRGVRQSFPVERSLTEYTNHMHKALLAKQVYLWAFSCVRKPLKGTHLSMQLQVEKARQGLSWGILHFSGTDYWFFDQ